MLSIEDIYFKSSENSLVTFKDFLAQNYKKALFYPGCGLDVTDLEIGKYMHNIFVRADYRITKDQASEFLKNQNFLEEYDLVNFAEIDRSELIPENKLGDQLSFPYKSSEIEILKQLSIDGFPKEKTVLVGIYYLKNEYSYQATDIKLKDYIVILFFYEEALSVFNDLFFRNKINPTSIVLKENISEHPYWTYLDAPDYRFRSGLLLNCIYNATVMPDYLITDQYDYSCKSNLQYHTWKDYFILSDNRHNQFVSISRDNMKKEFYIYLSTINII